MARDWQELTDLARGEPFVIERIRLLKKEIVIEGQFELPPLVKLSSEDQVFVGAFVRSHGSIKRMEEYFGVSYPTIKNRLNRISEQLEFVKIRPLPERGEILGKLERGEISAKEAIELLKQ